MNQEEARQLTRKMGDFQHFFRFWFPYAFHRIESSKAKWAYLPLNRNYKPLGQLSSDRVDYNVLGRTHGVRFRRDPASYKGVWLNDPEPGAELLYLYSDAPSTRLDYFTRLERLMSKAISILEAVK